MRLRLYHHSDAARIAYRESGTGPALVLLHSLGLSHREYEPVVKALSERFRVVIPDLPLHGDSEDRPYHSYSPDWMLDVLAGFCASAGGSRATLVGHGIGAELALKMVASERYRPARLVLLTTRLHRQIRHAAGVRSAWRVGMGLASVPGLDVAISHGARMVARPVIGKRLTVAHNPAAQDLVRHAFSDVAGNGGRARAWAKFVRSWPSEAQLELLDAYPKIDLPVLLLWSPLDRTAPIEWAQEAIDLLPDADLRTLPETGFLVAYDDPVGLARELIAFCG
jgi:pimeloyl-ACP methyl ester carboxylesterase